MEKENSKPEKIRSVSICAAPLSTKVDEIFCMRDDDARLVEEIVKYSSHINIEKDIETFERKGNIIVTTDGYFIAIYTDQLQLVEQELN